MRCDSKVPDRLRCTVGWRRYVTPMPFPDAIPDASWNADVEPATDLVRTTHVEVRCNPRMRMVNHPMLCWHLDHLAIVWSAGVGQQGSGRRLGRLARPEGCARTPIAARRRQTSSSLDAF